MKICSQFVFCLAGLVGLASMASAEPGGSVADSLKPRKLVVAIGVRQFQDDLWHDLKYAGKDADDLYDYFLGAAKRFDGGQLINQEVVTKADVEQALKRLQDNNRNEDDTVILYLSTHGTVAYRSDGRVGRYIITSDTDSKNVAATAIDYDRLVEQFKSLKSRRKVLILAFCHSGVGKSVLTPAMKKALAMLKSPYFEEPIQARSEGTLILSASGWREPALEHPDLENDVYTHFLIKGFAADSNGDGGVSIMEAHSFAAQKTYQFTDGRQRPSAVVEMLGLNPIMVSGATQAKPRQATLYSLLSRYVGLEVRIDNQDLGAVEKGVSVPAGKVRLTLIDPKKQQILTDRMVRFEAGREYSVANLLIPVFPNSLQIGPTTFRVTDGAVQSQYLPESLLGVQLAYRRNELLGPFDLGLVYRYFPPVDEQVHAAGGALFQQTRNTMALTIPVSTRDRLDLLSRSDRQVMGEYRLAVVPGVFGISRELDNPAVKQGQVNRATPSLGFEAGLEFTFPYYLLKVSANAGYEGLYQLAEDSRAVTGSTYSNLAIGSFW